MKKNGFMLAALVASMTLMISCSKSDAIDPQNEIQVANSTNASSAKEQIEWGNLAGSVDTYIKGTIVNAVSAENTYSTSVDETGEFHINDLISGVYDIYFYYEVNGEQQKIVLERISVKPNTTTNIGVVILP